MEKFTHERLQETYFKEILKNGLTVYLYPKRDFSTTCGYMITKFGSDDITFIPNGEKEYYTAPLGIAHFLEHKLFESSTGVDASTMFDSLCASCNAYTTNDRTVFYFSTTKNEYKCVETLIDLVQMPYFTDESVEKEKGIIIQEINMHKNRAGNHLYMNLLNNLYFNLPCKNDIGGTEKSVNAITKEDLYKTYNTFYQPSNIALVVVGNFELDKMIDVITQKEESLGDITPKKIERKIYDEPEKIVNEDTTSHFDVTIPKVGCAIKIDMHNFDKIRHFNDNMYIDYILDYYFDNSSDFVQRLKKKGIINGSLSYDVDYTNEYYLITLTADVNLENIDTFKNELNEELEKLRNTKFDELAFTRFKKSTIAYNIEKYNSLVYIAETICNLYMRDIELFEGSNLKEQLTYEECDERRQKFKKEMTTFHTVLPLK